MHTRIHGLAASLVALPLIACGGDDTSAASGKGTDGGAPPPTAADAAAQPGADAGDAIVYGQVYSGGEYHLGPVDYAETAFHNACAPSTKYSPAA